jgi:ketosteroid isomerase-like protein
LRLTIAVLTLLCACLQNAFSQNSPPTAPGTENARTSKDDSETIRVLENDWLKAERTTDPALLERIMAQDFVGIGSNGLTPGKTQLFKGWQPHAGQAPPYNVETSDMRIFVLGDTAVAAYTKTYTAKQTGNVAHEDVTDVFTKDHGIWNLRFSRATRH